MGAPLFHGRNKSRAEKDGWCVKKILVAAGVLPLVLSAAEVAPVVLRPAAGNTIELFVEKTGLLSGKKHRFVFDRYSVRVEPRGGPAQPHVTLEIDAASIRCTDTWVSEKDLKKIERTAREEMLEVGRYPVLRFESSGIAEKGTGRFEVTGMLTIRDRKRPVAVTVEEMPGGRGWRGSARLKLTDFRLKPPSAALGLVGTKDEMTVAFVLKTE